MQKNYLQEIPIRISVFDPKYLKFKSNSSYSTSKLLVWQLPGTHRKMFPMTFLVCNKSNISQLLTKHLLNSFPYDTLPVHKI